MNSTNCEHFSIFTPYKSFELVWIALSARLSIGNFVIYRKFYNSIIGVVFLFDHMKCTL
jgi:hypothetical protein